MNRLLLITLIFILPLCLKAQPDVTDSMNTERFWKTITFEDHSVSATAKPALPADAENIMVIASNRTLTAGKTRFMSEARSNEGLNYFIVFIKNKQWQVWKTSIEAAIASVHNINDDWVIYTEGYGKIFTTGLYRGLSMTMQHHVNVIYLDYPSYSTIKNGLGNYKFALTNAKQAGYDFAPLLRTLKAYRENGRMGHGRITLFFHSMGNNALREIVKQDLLTPINNKVWVDNLVLNSACVPQRHHAEWVDKIRFAKRVYINYNPEDVTLSGATLVSLTRQLGLGARNHLSKQAIYINFNELCGRNHSNFVRLLSHIRTPSLALAYYKAVLHGRKVNVKDEANFTVSNWGLGYSIFPKKVAAKLENTTMSGAEEIKRPHSGASAMFH
jgi:hypothetical protein